MEFLETEKKKSKMDNLQNGIYSRLDTLAEKIRNVIKKKHIKYPTLSKKRNKQT